MLDAALAYAAHGFPVFPLTVDKKPVPARDRDANGKPIPGTGAFKKATTDPVQIRAWWERNEYLIGLPMGAASGVWCLDVDTSEDHADGVAEWDKIAAQHEPIVTREHRSATGGPHLIFDFRAGRSAAAPASCPTASRSRARAATSWCRRRAARAAPTRVHRDIDPIHAAAVAARSDPAGTHDGSDETFPRPGHGRLRRGRRCDGVDSQRGRWLGRVEGDGAAALRVARGRRVRAVRHMVAEDASTSTIQTRRSKRGSKSQPRRRTAPASRRYSSCARQHGWTPRLFECAPTYAASDGDADAARRETQSADRRVLAAGRGYHALTKEQPGVRERGATSSPTTSRNGLPPVEAMRVDTGIGKTEAAIVSHAARRLRGAVAARGIVYTVDRHLLGSKIDERFTALGTRARMFRGRGAADPRQSRASDVPRARAVALAMKTHADINETCCRQGDKVCPLLARCGYQRQMQGEAPEVWITAHDMLFHAQPASRQAGGGDHRRAHVAQGHPRHRGRGANGRCRSTA